MERKMSITTNQNTTTSSGLLEEHHHHHQQQQQAPPNPNSNNNNNNSSNDSNSETKVNDENQWHILEGLKDGQRYETQPQPFSGYMLKRRKWPLKGWHRRYFHLENGILSYAKNATDMGKKKLHGSTDIGLSVISFKLSSRRIDIDSDVIYHLKAYKGDFKNWVNALRTHRLARQHKISYGNQLLQQPGSCDNNHFKKPNSSDNNYQKQWPLMSSNLSKQSLKSPQSPQDGENSLKYQTKIQEKLIKLSSLLRFIEVSENSGHPLVDLDDGYKYKKSRLKFHLRRKKPSNAKRDSAILPSINTTDNLNLKLLNQSYLSVSHPLLSDENVDLKPKNEQTIAIKPSEYDDQLKSRQGKPLTKDSAMQEFVQLANEINNYFRQLMKNGFQDQQQQSNDTLTTSRDGGPKSEPIDDGCDDETSIENDPERSFERTFSLDEASVMSISEYHDAEDRILRSDSDNSSSSSVTVDDEESVTDFSEDLNHNDRALETISKIERRTKLPSVQPTNDISLWSLLYKNIGKDLSKICMPVTINEPLNLLQRLCEELEYCELLDMASSIDDPYQKMLMISAFAVSSYCSSYYRVGHKPFNPLLGETYECVREDKGFKFIAEQVSHHPPISACHADSKNYVFWQDMRVKTKFWGKSMEIIPIGTVNVILKRCKTHYKWNKITTCVHNLFKGERYVDTYGELTIQDTTNDLTCKITFEKASYWSNKQNQISGYIMNHRGEIVERIYGKWNESVHNGSRCLWRAGTMPDDYQSYYGFTRFAIELNELTDVERPYLPPTDTRFRPDQRLLEEGKIDEAETIKLKLEQGQRDRRKTTEQNDQPEHGALWFNKQTNDKGEVYLFNHKYWEARENKFKGYDFIELF